MRLSVMTAMGAVLCLQLARVSAGWATTAAPEERTPLEVRQPSPCLIDSFKAISSRLEKHKIESVLALADSLEALAKHQPGRCVSELMDVFDTFYHKAIVAYDDQRRADSLGYKFDYDDPRWADSLFGYEFDGARVTALNLELSTVGWKLYPSEGEYYLGEASGWYLKRFVDILPTCWREYCARRDIEIDHIFWEDGGVEISWDELRARIVSWEFFLKRYPEFPKAMRDEVSAYVDMYLQTFLTGTSNSPIFVDSEIGANNFTLDADVKAAYERFLSESRDSQFYALVKDYYEFLRANSFKWTDTICEYWEKAGIRSMSAQQLPGY